MQTSDLSQNIQRLVYRKHSKLVSLFEETFSGGLEHRNAAIDLISFRITDIPGYQSVADSLLMIINNGTQVRDLVLQYRIRNDAGSDNKLRIRFGKVFVPDVTREQLLEERVFFLFPRQIANTLTLWLSNKSIRFTPQQCLDAFADLSLIPEAHKDFLRNMAYLYAQKLNLLLELFDNREKLGETTKEKVAGRTLLASVGLFLFYQNLGLSEAFFAVLRSNRLIGNLIDALNYLLLEASHQFSDDGEFNASHLTFGSTKISSRTTSVLSSELLKLIAKQKRFFDGKEYVEIKANADGILHLFQTICRFVVNCVVPRWVASLQKQSEPIATPLVKRGRPRTLEFPDKPTRPRGRLSKQANSEYQSKLKTWKRACKRIEQYRLEAKKEAEAAFSSIFKSNLPTIKQGRPTAPHNREAQLCTSNMLFNLDLVDAVVCDCSTFNSTASRVEEGRIGKRSNVDEKRRVIKLFAGIQVQTLMPVILETVEGSESDLVILRRMLKSFSSFSTKVFIFDRGFCCPLNKHFLLAQDVPFLFMNNNETNVENDLLTEGIAEIFSHTVQTASTELQLFVSYQQLSPLELKLCDQQGRLLNTKGELVNEVDGKPYAELIKNPEEKSLYYMTFIDLKDYGRDVLDTLTEAEAIVRALNSGKLKSKPAGQSRIGKCIQLNECGKYEVNLQAVGVEVNRQSVHSVVTNVLPTGDFNSLQIYGIRWENELFFEVMKNSCGEFESLGAHSSETAAVKLGLIALASIVVRTTARLLASIRNNSHIEGNKTIAKRFKSARSLLKSLNDIRCYSDRHGEMILDTGSKTTDLAREALRIPEVTPHFVKELIEFFANSDEDNSTYETKID